jgi:DNA-binding NarL/FixJ family response regulator
MPDRALADSERQCGIMDLQVYLIEEHTQVREALAERLSKIEGVELVGWAGDAQVAIGEMEKLRPQVILIESKREDGLGLELVRQAARATWNPRVVVLTTYEVAWERRAVRRAGAQEYLLKEIDSAELLKRIQSLPPRKI